MEDIPDHDLFLGQATLQVESIFVVELHLLLGGRGGGCGRGGGRGLGAGGGGGDGPHGGQAQASEALQYGARGSCHLSIISYDDWNPSNIFYFFLVTPTFLL